MNLQQKDGQAKHDFFIEKLWNDKEFIEKFTALVFDFARKLFRLPGLWIEIMTFL